MSDSAILCVDDEVAILEALKEQLVRRFGKCYCYEIAENVDEAWEIIETLQQEETKIVVIVSDWLMPGVKGDEFLIQVHQRSPEIVTILLTGQADDSAIALARQKANLHACLYKPWTEEELSKVILSGLGLEKNLELG